MIVTFHILLKLQRQPSSALLFSLIRRPPHFFLLHLQLLLRHVYELLHGEARLGVRGVVEAVVEPGGAGPGRGAAQVGGQPLDLGVLLAQVLAKLLRLAELGPQLLYLGHVLGDHGGDVPVVLPLPLLAPAYPVAHLPLSQQLKVSL